MQNNIFRHYAMRSISSVTEIEWRGAKIVSACGNSGAEVKARHSRQCQQRNDGEAEYSFSVRAHDRWSSNDGIVVECKES
jgi:hypothetical protein